MREVRAGLSPGAKWDSRTFLDQAVENGAELVSGRTVKRVVIERGRATGVVAGNRWQTRFYPADLVILAAGGLGTPPILEQSGIACRPNLFVDPVLCVATRWDDARQNQEMPMPFIVQREHYMISPYFDFLSFFFNRRWKYPAGDVFSLMIKLADDNRGQRFPQGYRKGPVGHGQIETAGSGGPVHRDLRAGWARSRRTFSSAPSTPATPAGCFRWRKRTASTLHHDSLPANLYVADASLLPESLGNPRHPYHRGAGETDREDVREGECLPAVFGIMSRQSVPIREPFPCVPLPARKGESHPGDTPRPPARRVLHLGMDMTATSPRHSGLDPESRWWGVDGRVQARP